MNYDDDSVSHEQRAGRGWMVVRVLGGPLGCPGDRTRAVGSISGHGSWPGCRGASTGSPLVVKRGQFYPRAPSRLSGWLPGRHSGRGSSALQGGQPGVPRAPSTSQRLAPEAASQGGVVFKVMFPERDKELWSADESC